MDPVILGLLAVLAIAIGALIFAFRKEHQKSARLESELDQLRDVANRYSGIIDLENEQRKLRETAEATRQELARARQAAAQERERLTRAALEEHGRLTADVTRLRAEVAQLDEEQMFQDHGLYTPRFDFETSERYKQRLAQIRAQQKAMVKQKSAAVCTTTWTVGGSEAKGRKMARDNIKLMLRAFNGECDAAVAKVRYNNVDALANRIRKSSERINKMNEINHCHITDAYLQLKLNELYLTHELRERQQHEREEQRRIKEQMREEQRATAEMEKAQRDAEKEETRYRNALKKARAEITKATGKKHARMQAKLAELERKLAEAEQNRTRAISRAQLTRSGHVYVISNIGSFGPNVFKIGMTRRLEPNDRVRELGDASVPFAFDVHAMIYSEDAPSLENKLHREFDERRVNKVNRRKEFFDVSLREIEDAVTRLHGTIEFTELAEAEEFRKTKGVEQARARAHAPPSPASVAAAG